jgi:hypothetical protein
LPEGAKIIMKKAFKGCYSLEELHLPRGLIKIDKNAFEGCENLKYVITHNIDPHNYQRWLPDGVELFDEESWKRRNQGD